MFEFWIWISCKLMIVRYDNLARDLLAKEDVWANVIVIAEIIMMASASMFSTNRSANAKASLFKGISLGLGWLAISGAWKIINSAKRELKQPDTSQW